MAVCPAADAPPAGALKVHAIFNSNMVIQRDKPIVVWGWAKPGSAVTVQLGTEKAETKAGEGKGRWEAKFPARGASAEPQVMTVSSGTEKVEMTNIVFGDVWVMNGQSNMALGLNKTQHADLEAAQANLPLLRLFSINPNEQSEMAEDIPADKITTNGWAVSTPESAMEFSAIGYVFGARVQRALGIPIGLIKNARGGASIESLVPPQMFDRDPVAKRYAESVKKRIAEFDPQATSMEIWGRQLARAKAKGLPEDKWPAKPENANNLTSWSIPGKSPNDMASCYQGMFGVFKGLNIKGVLFHQGFNNAMNSVCRPVRYRVLMRLMVEGWREDFNDPDLPVGVIEFCAGGKSQNVDNFETESNSGGPFIREAQRLGLADVANQNNLMFLAGYDVQVPGLHPNKKREHGERAAIWALAKIYPESGVKWREVKLLSAEAKGAEFVLTFDQSISPHTRSSVPEGFSIAGADGKFYMAHARYEPTEGHPSKVPNVIHVWSPLVKEPVAVRYAWATSPMGNLSHGGIQDRPFPSFRTDSWPWPESEDPAVELIDRTKGKEMGLEAAARCEFRRSEEAKLGNEILEWTKRFAATK